MEKELFMKRQKEWLNIPSRKQRSNQRCWSRCLSGAEVSRLTDLASCFVLSVRVRVAKDLGKEQNGRDSQHNSQCPVQIASCAVLANHLDFKTTPTRTFYYCTLG